MKLEILNNKINEEKFKPGKLYECLSKHHKGDIAVFGLETKELHMIGGTGSKWPYPDRKLWRELPAGTKFMIKEEN